MGIIPGHYLREMRMGSVMPGSEEDDPAYWRGKEREAQGQEDKEKSEAREEAKRASDAVHEKTEQALLAWSNAVEKRNKLRRNVGLTLAAIGTVAGLLLLWVAGHNSGFPEKLTEALGTAMLVAATVEVAARIIRKLIKANQKDVDTEIATYLKQIDHDVVAIHNDLMEQSLERQAERLATKTAQTAKFKASLADRRDRILRKSSRSALEQSNLRSIERILAMLPAVRDSDYYGARADLLEDRKMKQIEHQLKQIEHQPQGGRADKDGAANIPPEAPEPS
jgi:hypothetical protein